MGSNDWPVIFTYTDAQALEDGVLVDVSVLGIHTRKGVWVIRATAALAAAYPDRLEQVIRYACGNGREDDGWYIAEFEGKTIWVIPNELGAYTAMFPDDY